MASRTPLTALCWACFGPLGLMSALVAACIDEDGGGPLPLPDATDTTDATDATSAVDGANDARDAGSPDATKDARSRDANGPGAADATCSFNFDCQLALRCECDETTGCACKQGPRGTGKNGVDKCVDGNGCESAVCVEGPADAGFYCSDECVTADDCVGALPQCTTIAFVGRICIRNAP